MSAGEIFARDTARIRLSQYLFEPLQRDNEFLLYRGRADSSALTILALAPLSEYPAPATIRKRLVNPCCETR
jgi:hypothetical protein